MRRCFYLNYHLLSTINRNFMDTRRFNNPSYKRQINAVRHYRRNVVPRPESALGRIFGAIGLGSVFRKICAALVLFLAIYLVYFAKFLQITQAQISGADQKQEAQISSRLADYERTFNFIFPQKNILFFSSKGFSKYLLGSDVSISSVAGIRRKPFHSLSITVVQKVPAFVLQSNGNFFILNSDGSLGMELPPGDPQISAYPKVIDTAAETVSAGEKFLPQNEFGFLSYMRENFQKDLRTAVDHFEIPGKNSGYLTLYLQTGARIYFNSADDPQIYMQKLLGLWNSLSADQQKNLAYFDLRFNPDAYGCFLGSACAVSAAPQLPQGQQNGAQTQSPDTTPSQPPALPAPAPGSASGSTNL